MEWKCILQKFRAPCTLCIIILIPIILLPLPLLHPTSISRCAYCLLLMSIYWITDLLPVTVTSLLPLVLFPTLGIMPASEVATKYFDGPIPMLIGSMIVAIAIQKCNLHKRLSLTMLLFVGTQIRQLILGIMVPCWFLSMWMSNSATTALMMPIVIAILQQIKDCRKKEKLYDEEEMDRENTDSLNGRPLNVDEEFDEEFSRITKCLSLCVPYAAGIGGIATITGTSSNIMSHGLIDDLYRNHGLESGLTFFNWLMVALPASMCVLVFTYFWLCNKLDNKRSSSCQDDDDSSSFQNIAEMIQKEYRDLGGLSFQEIMVIFSWCVLVLLWTTKEPGFIKGWCSLFKPRYVSESTAAIFVSILLFILPAKNPFSYLNFSSYTILDESALKYETLLDWKAVHDNLTWGALFLVGGGIALADGCQRSGLSEMLGEKLFVLSSLPVWLIGLLLSLIVTVCTEFLCNGGTIALFVPIAGQLAIKLGVNPLRFMISCAICATMSTMLPSGSAYLAIAYSYGLLRIKDMISTGIAVSAVCILTVNLAINTWGAVIFGLDHFPEKLRNETMSTLATR